MKIENLKDITDESLQTLTASAIHEFIQESLKTASEEYSSKKTEQEDSLNDAREQHETLSKEHASLETKLEDVMAQLNKLEAEKAEKDKQEAFNQRMAPFDERKKLRLRHQRLRPLRRLLQKSRKFSSRQWITLKMN